MKALKLLLITTLLGATLLCAAVAPAAAAPPQYPNGWTFTPSGLRQIPSTVDTRALCKGPRGTVYEVALGQTTASYASISRIRVSDGAVIRSWAYPATPGGGVIPRAAASDARGNLFVAVETQAGATGWTVVKFTRSGKRLWRRTYDSGKGSDVPYGMVVDHHGAVIVAGTREHAGGYDGAVIKWSATGRLKWKRFISGPRRDLIGAVAVDANDNVYAAGNRSRSGGFGSAILRSWTAGGRQRWTATATNPLGTPAWRFLVVKGTSVYVAGQTSDTPSSAGFMAMKYTTGGRRGWRGIKSLYFDRGAWARGLAVDRAGAPVIVGSAYEAGVAGQDVGAVWKLTARGATSWRSAFVNFDWPYDGEFDAVGVDRRNRVYAAGGQWVGAGTGNLLIVRYSAAGAEQAMWRSEGQQTGYCAFSDLLVLDDTTVIAAGRVAGNGADAGVYRARTTP